MNAWRIGWIISMATNVLAFVVIHLQSRKLARQDTRLREQADDAGRQSLELHRVMAENDELREQQIKLLDSWVTGEPS